MRKIKVILALIQCVLILGDTIVKDFPCYDAKDVEISTDLEIPIQFSTYNILINRRFNEGDIIYVKFHAPVHLVVYKYADKYMQTQENIFMVYFTKSTDKAEIQVVQQAIQYPYVQSLKAYQQKTCKMPSNMKNIVTNIEDFRLKGKPGGLNETHRHGYACSDSTNIYLTYQVVRVLFGYTEYGYTYRLEIEGDFERDMRIFFKFNEDVNITWEDDFYALVRGSDVVSDVKLYRSSPYNHYGIRLLKDTKSFSIKIHSKEYDVFRFVERVDIFKDKEFCYRYKKVYFREHRNSTESTAVNHLVPNAFCGRRQVRHTELIVNGVSTKPGDWPWHVALYKLGSTTFTYICGGTIISKTFVLSAAHCVTVRGVRVIPELLSVVLGKYNLIGGDPDSEERLVHQIIIHDRFEYKTLNHDISLLKLKTEAVFNQFIQPACLWNNKFPDDKIFGSVVGWGFSQNNALSPQLQQGFFAKISDLTCIRRNPIFYNKILTENKFCASGGIESSPCNGDSGGGYMVFFPDSPDDDSSNAPGAYHIRGIVSVAASRPDEAICDPTQYTVYTDVARYVLWIKSYATDIDE